MNNQVRHVCYEFKERSHDRIDWGGAAETNHMIYQDNIKKRRKKYFNVDRKPTHNIMWFHRSNRSCVRPQEKGRNFIKTLGKYNKNYLHLTLRRLQALDGRQEQRTLVVKLLSSISYLNELHP